MCPFIFAATSGQEDEPPHKERATAPRLCAPSSSPKPAVKKANCRAGSVQPPRGCVPPQLRCNRRSNMGAQAHMSCNRRAGYWVRKNRTAARANTTSPRGPSRKTEKISFQNQCSDPRHPTHGPTVTLSTKVTGQSTVGIGAAVGMTIGRPAVITSTGA